MQFGVRVLLEFLLIATLRGSTVEAPTTANPDSPAVTEKEWFLHGLSGNVTDFDRRPFLDARVTLNDVDVTRPVENVGPGMAAMADRRPAYPNV